MQRALDLLDQLCDVVEGKPWLQVSEIAGPYAEGLPQASAASLRQPAPEGLVDHLTEGATCAPRFRLQLGRHVVVQGKGRSHALMLILRHHDVNPMGCAPMVIGRFD